MVSSPGPVVCDQSLSPRTQFGKGYKVESGSVGKYHGGMCFLQVKVGKVCVYLLGQHLQCTDQETKSWKIEIFNK